MPRKTSKGPYQTWRHSGNSQQHRTGRCSHNSREKLRSLFSKLVEACWTPRVCNKRSIWKDKQVTILTWNEHATSTGHEDSVCRRWKYKVHAGAQSERGTAYTLEYRMYGTFKTNTGRTVLFLNIHTRHHIPNKYRTYDTFHKKYRTYGTFPEHTHYTPHTQQIPGIRYFS